MRKGINVETGEGGSNARRTALAAGVLAALLILLGQPHGGRAALSAAAPDGPLVVTISDGGMTPSQATAPAGLVHLRVDNHRTNTEALTLRVTREGGALVRDIQLPEGSHEAATELDLAAGSYTLTEAAHPSWTCHLTVQ